MLAITDVIDRARQNDQTSVALGTGRCHLGQVGLGPRVNPVTMAGRPSQNRNLAGVAPDQGHRTGQKLGDQLPACLAGPDRHGIQDQRLLELARGGNNGT